MRDGANPAACQRMQTALAIVPGVSQRFELEAPDGQPICNVGEIGETGDLELVAPGAILVRKWKDQRYQVTVMEKGFAYEGKTYDSLSKVAFAITGTRWNGPRFFGLRAAAVSTGRAS